MDTLTLSDFEKLTTEEVMEHLHVQDSERAFCVYEALKRGVPHQTIYDITKIDWWFLDKMQHLANLELGLKNGPLTREKYLDGQALGFLDKTILRLSGAEKLPMARNVCRFKMVDTCAAEFAAKTPYSTPPSMRKTRPSSSSMPIRPARRRSSSSAPAPSASARASSSTTALSTQSGR